MDELNIISIEKSVRDAIRLLDLSPQKYVCVVDEDNILKGLFTQGDMRKYLLSNGDISQSVNNAMNPNPAVFSSKQEAIEASLNDYLVVYPIVDSEMHLLDCYWIGSLSDYVKKEKPLQNIPVVIMAGGKGTRLYPYTKILPKALIPIGDITITERIINQFKEWGCCEFYIIINHKAGMIKAYFEEIDKDYNIYYIEEKEFLGTGGGLSLLKGFIKSTFILTNCDILVSADYECILKTHLSRKNIMTFVASMKDITIPYGVITTSSDGQIVKMMEKPELSFLTNTGLYVLEPRVIYELNENKFIHITDIAQNYIDKKERIGVFPVSGKSWLDMGQFKEMDAMLKALEISE